jgi:hypothetical protein
MPYRAKRKRHSRKLEIEREVAELVASAIERSQSPLGDVPQEVLVIECATYFGPFSEFIGRRIRAVTSPT